MKKIVLFVYLIVACGIIQAQMLNESFDQGLPDGWTIVNNDGDQYTFTVPHQYSVSGTSDCAGIRRPTDDYLITPLLAPETGNNQLVFRTATSSTYYRFNFEVMVSTTNNNVGSFTQIQSFTDYTNTNWSNGEQTIDLSAYNGQLIYVAFRVTYCSGSYGSLGFDDFTGVKLKLYDNDLAMKNLIVPEDPIYATANQVYAIVKNLGNNVQTSGKILNFYDKTGSCGTALTTKDLNYGEIDTVPFTWNATPGIQGLTVVGPTDENNSNISYTYAPITVYKNHALYESFEGDFLPLDWESTNSIWSQSSSSYHENKSAYANDVDTLITPLLVVEDGDFINFYAKGSYYGGEMKVLISDDKASWTELSYITTLTNSFQQFQINLTAAEVGNKYIAFALEDGYNYLDLVTGPPIFMEDNDLQLLDIIYPIEFMEEGDYEIKAVVRNKGVNTTLAGQAVTFKDNGTTFGTVNTNLDLEYLENDTVTITWTGVLGEHEITASVPSDDYVANNETSVTLDILHKLSLKESFEGEMFPPEYWEVKQNKWDTYSSSSYHGDYSLRALTGTTYYDTLITPMLVIEEGDKLKFHARNSGILEILISEDKENWTEIDSINLTKNFEQYVVNFGAGDAGQRFIAFSVHSGTAYLDFVYGPKLFKYDNDAGIAEVISPSSFILPGYHETKVVIENYGLDTITSAQINWKVDGVEQEQLSWTGSLAYGDVDTVNVGSRIFDQDYHEIVAYTSNPNGIDDDFSTNDTTQFAFKTIEEFNEYLPNQWEEMTGILTDSSIITGTYSYWYQDEFGNTGDNDCAAINISYTNRDEWLVSPVIDLGDGSLNYSLVFDLAHTAANGTEDTLMGEDDYFAVVVSTDQGTKWSIDDTLRTWTNDDTISNTGELVSLDLSGYSGKVKLGFYAESTVSNTSTDLFIDNIKFTVATYDVTFNVSDGTNALEGAKISLDFYGELTTDVNGQAVYSGVIPASGLDYTITLDEYNEVAGTIAVSNENIVENVAMDLTTYTVTFNVTDGANALDGATVELTGYGTKTTNASGEAVFEDVVPANDISYTVNLEAYDEKAGVISVVDQDITEDVAMDLTTYNVTFNITDGTNTLENVSVELSGYGTQITNTNGITVFEDVVPEENINYSATLSGYGNVTGTLSVSNQNISEDVEMVLLTYTVTFNVTDGTNPIEGAAIVFGSYGVATTNTSGEAVYNDVVPENDISFSISKEGYITQNSTLNVVDEDVTKDIALEVDGVEELRFGDINVYPIPTNGVLNIDSKSPITSISIYNVQGVKVFEDYNCLDNNKINLSNMNEGFYIVKIRLNGSVISRRIQITE